MLDVRFTLELLVLLLVMAPIWMRVFAGIKRGRVGPPRLLNSCKFNPLALAHVPVGTGAHPAFGIEILL